MAAGKARNKERSKATVYVRGSGTWAPSWLSWPLGPLPVALFGPAGGAWIIKIKPDDNRRGGTDLRGGRTDRGARLACRVQEPPIGVGHGAERGR